MHWDSRSNAVADFLAKKTQSIGALEPSANGSPLLFKTVKTPAKEPPVTVSPLLVQSGGCYPDLLSECFERSALSPRRLVRNRK